MSGDWREYAIDRTPPGWPLNQWLLGEDEYEELWVPSITRRNWWAKRYSPRKPWHWPFWLLSRITRRLAMIEVIYP